MRRCRPRVVGAGQCLLVPVTRFLRETESHYYFSVAVLRTSITIIDVQVQLREQGGTAPGCVCLLPTACMLVHVRPNSWLVAGNPAKENVLHFQNVPEKDSDFSL